MQNISAAQINIEEFGQSERQDIEAMTNPVKNGETNYFQDKYQAKTVGTANNLSPLDQVAWEGEEMTRVLIEEKIQILKGISLL